jgi:hypothetical protein
MSRTAMSGRRNDALKVILWGGLLAGVLDGMDALVSVWIRGIPIVRLFQFIASGLIGMRAFHGGWSTALLGGALHLGIATGAASVYCALSHRLPLLLRRPVLFGPIFGLGVFSFMHYLVVPLSAAPTQPPPTASSYLNLLFSHIFFVGLPIALIASRSARV